MDSDPEKASDSDQVVTSVLFPDLSMFDSDSDDESVGDPPISPWALAKIGTFQSRLDTLVQTRQARHGQKASVAHVPTSMILRLANDVFGFNGWSSTIVDCAPVSHQFDDDNEKYSMKHEAQVLITLKDGTASRAAGVGDCINMPHKYMCLGHSRKMAITDGLRNALLNLTGMSLHQEIAIKGEASG